MRTILPFLFLLVALALPASAQPSGKFSKNDSLEERGRRHLKLLRMIDSIEALNNAAAGIKAVATEKVTRKNFDRIEKGEPKSVVDYILGDGILHDRKQSKKNLFETYQYFTHDKQAWVMVFFKNGYVIDKTQAGLQ